MILWAGEVLSRVTRQLHGQSKEPIKVTKQGDRLSFKVLITCLFLILFFTALVSITHCFSVVDLRYLIHTLPLKRQERKTLF